MVVRSNLLLGGVLGLALAGCAGNLLVGVTPDGGDEIDQPPGAAGDAGGLDAKVADASVVGTGGKDGAATSVPSGSDAATGTPPTPGKDAGTSPSSAGDAGVVVGTRDFSGDKATFLGDPRCPADVLLCDDFEGPALGAQPGSQWSYPLGYTPKIDATHSARGDKSVLFNIKPGTAALIQTTKAIFPLANNTVYGRMLVWIEGLPTTPNYAHWTVVGASASGGTNKAEVRLDGQLADNVNRYGVGSDGGDTGDWHRAGTESQSVAVEKGWTCLEWLFKGDSSETRIWIDSVEQTSLHTTKDDYRTGDTEGGKTFTHPTFDQLRIGYYLYQGDAQPTNVNVWIDEVIFDKARIGCVL